jgi:hypothetical protein
MTARLRNTVLATALFATLGFAGCGGGSDTNTDMFVGIWNYTTGTETITCNGGSSTDPLSGNLTVGHGIDTPLVMVFDPCTQGLKMTISGTSANVVGGQMCTQNTTVSDANGNPLAAVVTLIFNAGAFTVTGTSATVSAGGNANLVAGGATIPCTFTQTGTASKVSK